MNKKMQWGGGADRKWVKKDKLTQFYDDNDLALKINDYTPDILSEKQSAALLYLVNKYKTKERIALACGLKPSTINQYIHYLCNVNYLIRTDRGKVDVNTKVLINEE